jgi:hypothetical protein
VAGVAGGGMGRATGACLLAQALMDSISKRTTTIRAATAFGIREILGSKTAVVLLAIVVTKLRLKPTSK